MADHTNTRACTTCGKYTRRFIRGKCSPCDWETRPPAECGACGQTKKLVARGMCNACYVTAHRAANGRNRAKYAITCEQCGKDHDAAEPEARFCGLKCAGIAWSESRPPKPTKPARTQAEIEASWRAQYSPLRAAYEDADHAGVIAAIRARSTETRDGCWEWQGVLSKDGYPTTKIGRRTLQVHRVSLEAREGKPLGTQQSHHVCANSCCVNPDHLQPATFAENIAEMKARNSYIARIAELEAALEEVEPLHPLLDRVAYAS